MNILIASLILWLFWIFFARMYKSLFSPDMNIVEKIILYGIGYLFLAVDIAYNITYGSILFLQLPSKYRLTFSERLRYTLQNDTGWRYRLARAICLYLVDPHQPGHCRVGEL